MAMLIRNHLAPLKVAVPVLKLTHHLGQCFVYKGESIVITRTFAPFADIAAVLDCCQICTVIGI